MHSQIAIVCNRWRRTCLAGFTQIGIPSNRYSGHYRGWIETYWTPMKEIFATGKISEKTAARVKTDRTQRMERGQFRRKMTKES